MTEDNIRLSDADGMLELPARVKLDRIDPTRDAARFEAIINSITSAAVAERSLLGMQGVVARQATVLGAIAAWSRPAFAAAALMLVVSGAALTMLSSPAVAAPGSLAESAGLSPALVEWSAVNHVPTADELVNAFDNSTTRGLR